MSEKIGGWHTLLRLLELVHLAVWLGGVVVSAAGLVWGLLSNSEPWIWGSAVGLAFFLFVLIWGLLLARSKRVRLAQEEALKVRSSAEVAVKAARSVIREGRWVYGPRTNEGAGHTTIEFGTALRVFDRAASEYLADDRIKLRAHSERISQATLFHDGQTWSKLAPLLSSLEKWIDWAEKEVLRMPPVKQHPLD